MFKKYFKLETVIDDIFSFNKNVILNIHYNAM